MKKYNDALIMDYNIETAPGLTTKTGPISKTVNSLNFAAG